MNNKKFMSLLLSLVMLITTFTAPVQAISSENINNKNSEVVVKLKGNVIGDEEVFEFDSSFIPTVDETISVEEGTLSIDGQEDNLDISGNTFIPQRAPQSSYNTEVNVKVNGINGSFDWSILPNGFTVKFEYQTADKTWHELSQNPTLTFKENNLQLTTTVPWPQNGTVKKRKGNNKF